MSHENTVRGQTFFTCNALLLSTYILYFAKFSLVVIVLFWGNWKSSYTNPFTSTWGIRKDWIWFKLSYMGFDLTLKEDSLLLEYSTHNNIILVECQELSDLAINLWIVIPIDTVVKFGTQRSNTTWATVLSSSHLEIKLFVWNSCALHEDKHVCA